MTDLNFENRFWLQILGDHLRFLELTLASKEKGLLDSTKALKEKADLLLAQARKKKNDTEANLSFALAVKNLKSLILERTLLGQVDICLPSTFINHMLNELEEYERILREVLETGDFRENHILDVHYLWDSDAAGHAISIVQNLDPTEKKPAKKFMKEHKCFEGFFNKALEYGKYSKRTELSNFPAIEKLNEEVTEELLIFINMLETLREERLDSKVLGTLNPLMADHMYRESVYVLRKIQQNSGKKVTTLDPAAPRITKV